MKVFIIKGVIMIAAVCLLSSCLTKRIVPTVREEIEPTENPAPDTAATVNPTGKIQTVPADQFRQLLLLDDIQLIDVRTPEEFKSGHINGAQNINLQQTDFNTRISKLDKEKPILVYCRSGKRSSEAAERLKAIGFTKIVELDGGILKWNEENLPLNK